MAERTSIRQGMKVRDREGRPLGRVLAVDGRGFVLERKVVVAREFRVGLDDVESVEDAGVVVLAQVPEVAQHLEQEAEVARAVDEPSSEAIWSSEHAHAAMREDSGVCNDLGHEAVEVTEHVSAYPIRVESGHVPSPRYLPWSQEEEAQERREEQEE